MVASQDRRVLASEGHGEVEELPADVHVAQGAHALHPDGAHLRGRTDNDGVAPGGFAPLARLPGDLASADLAEEALRTVGEGGQHELQVGGGDEVCRGAAAVPAVDVAALADLVRPGERER